MPPERAGETERAGDSVSAQAGQIPASAARVRRVRRLEPAAIRAIMSKDIVMFGRYWKATTFSSIVQPTIYLLAFGLGFGSLVSHVGHVSYVEYVGTGVVATAVLFSSAFPGMFNTFVRWQFQRTYDAMLAAPVDVEELITAEVLWISIRAGVYGMAPLLVAIAFGLEPSPGMLLVPLIGFVTGFGFAAFGVAIAAVAKTIDNFNYVTSAVLTPLFLVAGTFFPVSALPAGVRTVAQFNPLYHCVQLVRDASLGGLGTADIGHAAVLIAFALVMWRLAISQLGKRLID
jgi:lipooligosaccharide transport system permease protein